MNTWHRFSSVFHPQRACAAAGLLVVGACAPEPARVPARPVPDPIVVLEGRVSTSNGADFDYRAIVARDPQHPGAYLGTLDIPKQALSGASLRRVQFHPGQSVAFELDLPGTPRWVGLVQADGSIACQFTQDAAKLECSMRDVSARPALVPAVAAESSGSAALP